MENNEKSGAVAAVPDLSWMTRYEWTHTGMNTIDESEVGLNPDTEYVLLSDVQSLLSQQAQSQQGQSKIGAWADEEGRVISAATMETAKRDGGAMLSSVRAYTIPLYDAPVPPVTAPAGVGDQAAFEAWFEQRDEPNKCCQEAWKEGRASVAGNAKDAARYRWLSKSRATIHYHGKRGQHIGVQVGLLAEYETHGTLDEAIDATMTATPSKQDEQQGGTE